MDVCPFCCSLPLSCIWNTVPGTGRDLQDEIFIIFYKDPTGYIKEIYKNIAE